MIRGEMFAFTRAVGKGSMAQVEDFLFLKRPSTSCCETSGKQLRGWEISNCEWVVGTDRVEVPEMTERIQSIFVLKARKRL